MTYIDLEAKGMNLYHTFLNGQCFRWHDMREGKFAGVVGEKVYEAQMVDENTLRLHGASQNERDFFIRYFDLERDYVAIEHNLKEMDVVLHEAVDFGRGMRILKQDPWETLISFILSVQKNIASTQKTIECLCEQFGRKIGHHHDAYTFPTAAELVAADEDHIRQTKCGFRAKGVADAARQIDMGHVVLEDIFDMSYERGSEELQKIYGVGQKVADCILLFGFGKVLACPVDTWMKKAFEVLYHVRFEDMTAYSRFAQERWGAYSGYAQQYIFYFMRENYNKIKK